MYLLGGRVALRRAAAAVAVGLVIAGCSTNNRSASPGPSGVATSLGEPAAVGASDAARTIIERSIANGGLTRLDLDEAAQNAMACLESAGIVPQFTPPAAEYEGYSVAWTFDVGDGPDPAKADQFDMLANACVDAEYWPIDVRYTDQAQAVQLREQQQERWRAQAIPCLAGAGIALDEDAPWLEVAAALTDDFLARGDRSCHATLGIDGF